MEKHILLRCFAPAFACPDQSCCPLLPSLSNFFPCHYLHTPVNGYGTFCRFHGQHAYGRQYNWTADMASFDANPKTKVSTVSWYAHSLLARYQGTQTWAMMMNSTTNFNSLWGLTLHDTGDEVHPRVKPRHCHSV